MQFHNVYDVNFHKTNFTSIHKLLTNIKLFYFLKKPNLKRVRPDD